MRPMRLAACGSIWIYVILYALLGSFVPLAARAASSTTEAIPVNTEERVREYFADIPAMIAVSKCESGFRQYRADGTVLFDPTGTWMGAFQLSTIHLVKAFGMGMNITTLEGNMAYARRLYEAEGLGPWESSRPCWGSVVSQAPAPNAPSNTPAHASSTQSANDQSAPASGSTFTRPLFRGSTGADVEKLQQMLNASGFTIADAGPGSPGEETVLFGLLTEEAVRKFQCSQRIVCSGTPADGFGVFGPRTTAALLSYKQLSKSN